MSSLENFVKFLISKLFVHCSNFLKVLNCIYWVLVLKYSFLQVFFIFFPYSAFIYMFTNKYRCDCICIQTNNQIFRTNGTYMLMDIERNLNLTLSCFFSNTYFPQMRLKFNLLKNVFYKY